MQQAAKDLISLPIEMDDAIADTKFRLVHIAAQRVRQLSSGAPMQVSTKSIKDATVALEEAVAHSFNILVGEEAKKAKEEFRKQEERAKLEEQLSAKEEEIRKELSAYLSESHEETEGEGEADEEGSADAEADEEPTEGDVEDNSEEAPEE